MPDPQRPWTGAARRAIVPWTAVAGVLLAGGCTFGGLGTGAAGDGPPLIGYGSGGGDTTPATGAAPAAPVAGGAHSEHAFSIFGEVKGLFPGDRAPLVLTVINRRESPITVTSISTTVSPASEACGAANVVVGTYFGHLPVWRKATATVEISMARSAPDACEGAHFELHYRGVAAPRPR